MDKLTKYRSIIVAILQRHAQFTNSDDNAESCAICDEKTDNYLLSDVGWHASGLRLHSFPIHVRLKEDKFWIEWDGTEYGVANELMDAGVPEKDILLAFHGREQGKTPELMAA